MFNAFVVFFQWIFEQRAENSVLKMRPRRSNNFTYVSPCVKYMIFFLNFIFWVSLCACSERRADRRWPLLRNDLVLAPGRSVDWNRAVYLCGKMAGFGTGSVWNILRHFFEHLPCTGYRRWCDFSCVICGLRGRSTRKHMFTQIRKSQSAVFLYLQKFFCSIHCVCLYSSCWKWPWP